MQIIGKKSDCRPSLSNEKIVYFSLDQLLIYDFNFTLLKTISLNEEIRSCKISRTEFIAVALNDRVCLFRDYQEFAVINVKNVIGLDWDPKEDNKLLMCTPTHFMVYSNALQMPSPTLASGDNVSDKSQWNCICSFDLPYKPLKIEYSPCSKFIAILGDENKMMVWYNVSSPHRPQNSANAQRIIYDYVFLNHSTPVYNFEWRDEVVHEILDAPPRACLLTISYDNIGRLWSSCDAGYGFQNFDLAGVIEPTLSDKVSCIHWLTGAALNKCLEQYSRVKNFKDSLNQTINSKLFDTLTEFPDMLFQVTAKGSIIIWGIQGLGATPHRITRVNLIMRSEKTVSPKDFEYFGRDMVRFVAKAPGIYQTMPEMVLLGHITNQAMNAYLMNLDDFFNQNWVAPKLPLIHSWCGPKSSITQASKSPDGKYLATLDRGGEFCIYGIVEESPGLNIIGMLPPGFRVVSFSWIPFSRSIPSKHQRILLSDRNHVFIYDIQMELLATLPDSAGVENIVPTPFNDNTNSFLILGFKPSLSIFALWNVDFSSGGKMSYSFVKGFGVPSITPRDFILPFFQFDFGESISFQDSCVLFYSVNAEKKTVDIWNFGADGKLNLPDNLHPRCSFSIGCVGEIRTAKAASFGKLAIAHRIDQKSYVDVWDNEYSGMAMTREHQIVFDSDVFFLDWFTSFDGHHILAVGLEAEVVIYCRSHDGCGGWIKVMENDIMDGQISHIVWLSNGSLLISTSSSTKIMIPRNATADGNNAKHLLVLCNEISGRLPDYDPALLKQYLHWGKHDLVKYNLSMLYRFVKLSAERQISLNHIPIALWKIVRDGEEPQSVAGYEDLFGTTDQSALDELGVFSSPHVEFLVHNLESSGLSKIPELIAFIKAFEQLELHRKSLDDNGARFFTNVIQNLHLRNSKPLEASEFGWAYFSESQEYLISTITQYLGGKMKWKDAADIGFGYWVTKPSILKSNFELIARNQYWGENGVHDPVACSLFYFALKKKNVLLGLWKLASHHGEQAQMLKFLSNDFEDERWKNAALKNAFALLGKQRYEYAAAFFLLGGKLKDAANVCIRQLKDPQLAICICRIFEGENGPILNEICDSQLLPGACAEGNRWLTCLLWSMKNDREKAFYSITRPLKRLLSEPTEEPLKSTMDPNLMLLYDHLTIFYKKLIMQVKPKISLQEEREFILNCVRSYDRLGFPALALQMIVNLKADISPPYKLIDTTSNLTTANNDPREALKDVRESSKRSLGDLDWGEIESKPAVTLDWGEMESKPAVGLDWGEMESSLNPDPNEDKIEAATITKVEAVQAQNVMEVTAEELELITSSVKNIQIFKKFLIMRIVHELHNSTVVVSRFTEELKFDPILSKYFDYTRNGLKFLSELTNLNINKLGELIASRAIEMHSGTTFIELLPLDNNFELFVPLVEKMMREQSNMLCNLFFEPNSKRNLTWYKDVDGRSIELLRGWRSWQRKCPNHLQSQSMAILVLATGYIVQLVISTFLKKCNRLWWMCGLSEQLFDFLLKENFMDLGNLVDDILGEKPAVSHPDEHVQEQKEIGVDLYDEYGIALYQKDSKEAEVAVSLIYAMLISHIMSAFELFLGRLAELMNLTDANDSTFEFLVQFLDKKMINFLHSIDSEVAEKWKEYSMDLKDLPAYLLETDVSDLLSLLHRTSDFKKSSTSILSTKNADIDTKNSIGALLYDSDIEKVQNLVKSDLIASSNSPIVSFALNPLKSSQLAYATGKHIHEIDLEISGRYYGSSISKCNFQDGDSISYMEKNDEIRLSNVGLEALNIQREVSFDSMKRLVRRSFHANTIGDTLGGDTGLRLKRPKSSVSCLESHKSLNYFLAGSGDSSSADVEVDLYQFGQSEELVRYTAASEGKLTKCHFDPYGAKFGGSDSRGELHIWKFDASASSLKPCLTLRQCHQGAINDFAFLNSSSIIATAGMSSTNLNVSIWDTLMPPEVARVQSFSVGESGISSLTYSPLHNLLVAGGKKGNIFFIDLRQSMNVVNSFAAHDSNVVKSIAVDAASGVLYSGATKGDIKIWEINTASIASGTPAFRSFHPWPSTLDQTQALGVVDLKVSRGSIFSCWGNGIIFKSQIE